MQSHVRYTISILNKRLYHSNQLHKQRLLVSELTQVFMALDVAWFQYALPALADQLSAELILYSVEPIQLTSNSADLIEHCDKHLFRAALNPTHYLHSILLPAALNLTTVCIAC